MTADQWVTCLALVEPTLDAWIEARPPVTVAPCWHALAALDGAGRFTVLDDPLIEAARWEALAYLALAKRIPEAVEFARLCRGLADDCMGGIAA